MQAQGMFSRYVSSSITVLGHRSEVYCTALYCTALHCTALYCTALSCTAPYSILLHSTLFYPTTLYCSALIHPPMLTTPQVQEMLRICAEHLTDDAEHQSVAVLGIALVVLGEDVGTEVSHFIRLTSSTPVYCFLHDFLKSIDMNF